MDVLVDHSWVVPHIASKLPQFSAQVWLWSHKINWWLTDILRIALLLFFYLTFKFCLLKFDMAASDSIKTSWTHNVTEIKREKKPNAITNLEHIDAI